MDFEEGGDGGKGLAEHDAGDVGLAHPEGLGNSHSAVLDSPFLLTLPPAIAVPASPGSGLTCLPGDKSLPDRPRGGCKDSEDPVHHLTPAGCVCPIFCVELSSYRRVKIFTAGSADEAEII